MSAGEEPYDCTSDEEDEGENNHGNEDEDENGETEDEEEHRPQWAEDFAARAAARHTFALVLHDAAGADSPANVLSQELVSAVLDFLPKRQKGGAPSSFVDEGSLTLFWSRQVRGEAGAR